MKTKKSMSKRFRVTKNGKVIGRKPGQNHFNAKESRSKQLRNKRGVELEVRRKELSSYLVLP
ncbi:MAG: 50S ribosomal protein L35 [Candidatus Paceibacterota bacterium]|jgi:ribosomal protein L35